MPPGSVQLLGSTLRLPLLTATLTLFLLLTPGFALGNADMHTPISYALLYPERAAQAVEQFSILDYPTLTFRAPDRDKYPALDIAYECLHRGGTAPCMMNGANEVAVASFLGHKCGYLDIVGAIRYALDNASFTPHPTLEEYDLANSEARMLAARYLTQRS